MSDDTVTTVLRIVYDFEKQNKRGPTYPELLEKAKEYKINEIQLNKAYDILTDFWFLVFRLDELKNGIYAQTLNLSPEAKLVVSNHNL